MKKFFLFYWIFHFFSFLIAQNQDIIQAQFDLKIFPSQHKINGKVLYFIKIPQSSDSLVIDAHQRISIKKLRLNGRKTLFEHPRNQIIIKGKIQKENRLEIEFETENPLQAIYFTGWNNGNKNQVWTQGQGKKHSHWIPITDNMNDKFHWTLKMEIPPGYTGISNGDLIQEKKQPNGRRYLVFKQEKPVSSYLFFVGIGKYKPVERKIGQVKLINYHYTNARPKDVTFSKSKEIFHTLNRLIPYPYPWKTYREIPLRDFIYGGMENVSASTFHDFYYVNDTAWNDFNPVNILAHELAHQWFGNLVTETSSKHHWIHEGFATFYALETEKHIFGNNYTGFKYYTYRNEIFRAFNNGDTIPLLNGKASSTTFYKKGAWAIRMLRDSLTQPVFDSVISGFLKKFAYQNVTTGDFQAALFEVTKDSMKNYFDFWFKQANIPSYRIKMSSDSIVIHSTSSIKIPLRIYLNDGTVQNIKIASGKIKINPEKFAFYIPDPGISILANIQWNLTSESCLAALKFPLKDIDLYRVMKQCRKISGKQKFSPFLSLAGEKLNPAIYEELVFQMNNEADSLKIPVIKKLLRGNLKSRQAVAKNLDSIPTLLVKDFESLLFDPSYETIQAALIKLIRNFPEKAKIYLEKTKNIEGFNDHGFRMLWLYYAVQFYYETNEEKRNALNRLIEFASPGYDVFTRITALQWIDHLQLINEKSTVYIRKAAGYFHPELRRLAKKIQKKYALK